MTTSRGGEKCTRYGRSSPNTPLLGQQSNLVTDDAFLCRCSAHLSKEIPLLLEELSSYVKMEQIFNGNVETHTHIVTHLLSFLWMLHNQGTISCVSRVAEVVLVVPAKLFTTSITSKFPQIFLWLTF